MPSRSRTSKTSPSWPVSAPGVDMREVAAAPLPPSRASRRLTALFFGVLAIFCLVLSFEMVLLPSHTTVADAVPVGFSGAEGNAASTGGATGPTMARAIAGVAATTELLRRTSSPPNISVVMPCFGQVSYLHSGLSSVINQEYPPAEILVVDDSSVDQCGQVAKDLLAGSLAAARRRSIRQLQTWWGWGESELEHFRDEVLLTPNRGVAHARNTGIRRARRRLDLLPGCR